MNAPEEDTPAGRPITILCLASYFKGESFLEAAHEAGARVLLLTREKHREEAWPRASIDEIYFMPVLTQQPDILYAISYLARTEKIDRIVPLDDYDVPTAAALREHLRLEGMGETRTRYFRDKLAMRLGAQKIGLDVPAFSPVFNYDRLQAFMDQVAPPWLLKPRLDAGAMGIKKVEAAAEVWQWLEKLGDEQSYFLLEQFLAGAVYHVDSIVWDGQVLFAAPHKYGAPPMRVAHGGGVFMSHTLAGDSAEGQALLALNEKLLTAFDLNRGVAHTEFLRAEDGRYYFVETAARVGGANIEQLVEAASGINLWREWARLELAIVRGEAYATPEPRHDYAAVLICLARQEHPDLSAFQDPEIVYRLPKKQHAGLVVASPDPDRVAALMAEYGRRFSKDFLAVAPPLDRPPA